MSDPLLQIRNQHTVACGDPPIINGDDPNVYIGYFENAFGEQWVFCFDRTTGKAELRGGDIGWNTVHEVREGEVGALVLSREEAVWLQAERGRIHHDGCCGSWESRVCRPHQ